MESLWRTVKTGIKHLLAWVRSHQVTEAGSAFLRILLGMKWKKLDIFVCSIDSASWLWLLSVDDWDSPKLHLTLPATHSLSQILCTGVPRSFSSPYQERQCRKLLFTFPVWPKVWWNELYCWCGFTLWRAKHCAVTGMNKSAKKCQCTCLRVTH